MKVEMDMQVGYYRFPKDNYKTRRLNAICYDYYGMELVCFGPEDVDINNNIVRGKVLINGSWKEKIVPVPKIINNSPFKTKKTLNVYNHLEKNSYMMFKKYGDKKLIDTLLRKDGTYQHLLIPTKELVSFTDLMSEIERFGEIVLKPTNSSQGRGLYTIKKKKSNRYTVRNDMFKKTLELFEVEKFYIDNLRKRKYLVQKCINSRTEANQPFDVRVQFEKNSLGKWVEAQKYVRIGQANQLVSNISKGGSVIRWSSFTNSYFSEKKRLLYRKKLKEIVDGLPEKIEELFNANITSLAFDFGLDEQFYLFEVNFFPGGTFARGEIAMLRASYTKYLLENNMQARLITSNDYKSLYESLLEERNHYQREYNAIKNSKSWKITKPLRKVSNIINNIVK